MASHKKVRTRVIASVLACKICDKIIKECTTLADCLHSFCEKCIYKKVYEEKCHKCPACNAEISGSLLRRDTTKRSLRVSLLGAHKQTPEQRAERKRVRFENMQAEIKGKGKLQAAEYQAKKSQSTKKAMITYKDKGKTKVIDEPLVDQRFLVTVFTETGEGTQPHSSLVTFTTFTKYNAQSTKKPMVTYKDKGKEKVIDEPLYQSTKKAPISYKDKGKAKVTEETLKDIPYDPWDPFQVSSVYQKGVVIRSSPPRSPPPPPPPGYENEMISSKSKGKRPMYEIIPIDNEKMAVTTTVSGSKSMEPKRRVRPKHVDTPSNGTMISPQDVIDGGMNIITSPKKTRYAWFILTPSEEQYKKEPLRPLLEPNVRLKFDWNIQPTVSTLMKYIAMQLKLGSAEKVGIFMYGDHLPPEMKLTDVEDQWMELVGSERERIQIGTSAHHFCIQLTYA